LFDADQARRRVGSIDLVARSTNSATWHHIMMSDTRRRQRRSKKSFFANASLVDESKRHSSMRITQMNTMKRGVVARYINTHARQRLAGTFKGSLNHGSLKHDPDRARVSKNSNEKERRYLLQILLWHEDPRGDYHGEKKRRRGQIFIKKAS